MRSSDPAEQTWGRPTPAVLLLEYERIATIMLTVEGFGLLTFSAESFWTDCVSYL